MTDKERLEEIENNVRQQSLLKEDGLEHQVIIKLSDYIYLHEQTERAQKFEERLIERGHYTKRVKVKLEDAERLAETRLEKNLRMKRKYYHSIKDTEEENSRLREALEFYADKSIYNIYYDEVGIIGEDGGEKARKALKGESK